MALKQKNKIEASFSMSSMTDVVFLLLIFFMLTSSFITPSGLPLNLPSSKSSTIVMQRVSISISADRKFYIGNRQVEKDQLEMVLKSELGGKEGVVVLHADKSVPVEDLVYVAGIATSLEARVSVATKPN